MNIEIPFNIKEINLQASLKFIHAETPIKECLQYVVSGDLNDLPYGNPLTEVDFAYSKRHYTSCDLKSLRQIFNHVNKIISTAVCEAEFLPDFMLDYAGFQIGEYRYSIDRRVALADEDAEIISMELLARILVRDSDPKWQNESLTTRINDLSSLSLYRGLMIHRAYRQLIEYRDRVSSPDSSSVIATMKTTRN